MIKIHCLKTKEFRQIFLGLIMSPNRLKHKQYQHNQTQQFQMIKLKSKKNHQKKDKISLKIIHPKLTILFPKIYKYKKQLIPN